MKILCCIHYSISTLQVRKLRLREDKSLSLDHMMSQWWWEPWMQAVQPQGFALDHGAAVSPTKCLTRPGTVAHPYYPSTLGGWGQVWWIMKSGVRDQPGQYCETLSLLKIQKISWAGWCSPVIRATREAEAGESLEPRRLRLQWAEIVPLHSVSPGWQQNSMSKKPNQNKTKKKTTFEKRWHG